MEETRNEVRRVRGTTRDAPRSQRTGPKRTTYANASLQQAPCPVCGKFFSIRSIEQHADRCANQKFLDDAPRGAESVSEPATSGPKGSAGHSRVAKATKRGAKRGRKPTVKAPHTNTTASAGAELLLHVALGTFSQQRERSAQSPEESREHSISGEESVGRDQRGKSCPTAQTANKRQPRLRGCLPPQKPFTTTHPAHVKIMPTLEGEAVQFRGMPVFQTKDIPIHLTPLVKAVEDKLEALPNDAVFITTTKGAVDKRKTLELRQLIREEEYQLEMYGSNKKGKGRPRAPRKRSREPRIDLSSALIEAAEASAKSDRVGAANPPVETLPLPASSELQTENGAPPKLMMRVRVSNSGFYCEHSRNGSLIATSTSGRGAAENLAIDEEDTPLSDNEDEGGEIRQMPSPRSMKATQLDSQSHGYRVPSNKTAGDLHENPIRIDDDDDEDTQSFHRVPSSRQQLTNQDALNYVSRMRLHHKIDRATISKFVSLLKAYKTNLLSADVVARRIAELLKDFPDLVRDFNNFLPVPNEDMAREQALRDKASASPRRKRRRTSAEVALDKCPSDWRRYHEYQRQQYAYTRHQATYNDEDYCQQDHRMYYSAFGVHQIGGPVLLSMKASNSQDGCSLLSSTETMAEEHEEADEHRVDLSNGIYWRPVDYAGGSTMHDDCGFVGKDGVCTEISSSFAFADVWSSDNDFSDIDDEGREDPEEDLVDLLITKTEESRLPQNRHVVSPHRHDPPSAARIKVNAAVEEAVKNVSAKAASLQPEFMRDYEKMKELAYEVWERFKNDIYSFDAFAGIILEANRGSSSSSHLAALSKMLENLKCLFNSDAEDVIDKLIETQPEDVKRHMISLRASWQ